MKFIRVCLKTEKHLCDIKCSLSLALQLIVVTLGSEHEGDDPLEWLRHSVPGEPGVDYPILSSIQETSFSCDSLVLGGYYADPEQQCQAEISLKYQFLRPVICHLTKY